MLNPVESLHEPAADALPTRSSGRSGEAGKGVLFVPGREGVPVSEGFVALCLCAEWCGTCREYREAFENLTASLPEVRFRWLDIEDEAERMGDLDVENFPTLLVARDDVVLFFGTMLPHIGHLERLIETLRAQTAAESRDYAQRNEERRAWQADPDLRRLCALD